ncbi:BON1-associated protein 2-like [Tasmannia lanceolata]|uniref:BON1-associated protein 2-like n=1 Tax=Tasmannia lanceolata TaxID=3420 RepID=UPI004063AD96
MENSCCLEITVISAEKLTIAGRWIKKNAFVTVRTDSHNYRSTSVDRHGGSFPSWNEKLQLALPVSVKSFSVDVNCKTASGGLTMVGTANIPVSDILGDYVPAYYLHFLSYRLRGRDGERNGIVNLAVRLVGPECRDGLTVKPMWTPSLPVSARKMNCGSGVGVGIPVAYAGY